MNVGKMNEGDDEGVCQCKASVESVDGLALYCDYYVP
jgi:hypothetical protein